MSGNTDSTKAALDKVDDKWQAWSQHFLGVILQSGAPTFQQTSNA